MGWEDKNLVGDESTERIFPGGGKEQIFSLWEWSPPIISSRKANIYIYIYIYVHKWFSNIKLNKSAQWVKRLYLCRKRVNEYSNN